MNGIEESVSVFSAEVKGQKGGTGQKGGKGQKIGKRVNGEGNGKRQIGNGSKIPLHQVIAVEPSEQMRIRGRCLHVAEQNPSTNDRLVGSDRVNEQDIES